MSTMLRYLAVIGGLLAAGAASEYISDSAMAQEYPDRPITYVVPFPTGSSLDVVARLIAQNLSNSLGQPVVVENKPGAGGNVGTDFVVRSTPDGYTLLHTINSLAAAPALYSNLSFDPVEDLDPVVAVAAQPFMLVVNPTSPWKTVQELIDAAKADPGKLTFGSSGTGSLDHLAGELFNSTAGTEMLHVPYQGGAAVRTDIMAGRIDMAFTGMGAGLPLVEGGQLRALAVTSKDRSKALPDVPTLSETGLAGFEVVNSSAIYAPAGTPEPIIGKLNSEIVAILEMPDVRERLKGLGVEPIGGTPEELGAVLKGDVAKWKAVVEAAGIKPGN